MNVLMILNDQPYGTERTYNGLRLAVNLLCKVEEVSVTVFLMGDAVAAAKRLYAPKGVGALYVRRGTELAPLVLGAGHERGLRPGTENVASIVGLGQACLVAIQDLEVEFARQRQLREELWEQLHLVVPGLHLNGHPTERLPNTLNVSFPGVSGNALLAAAPELAASTGSACHEGADAPSPVLLAMGMDRTLALGAVRLSVGRSTTGEQLGAAVQILLRAYREVAS